MPCDLSVTGSCMILLCAYVKFTRFYNPLYGGLLIHSPRKVWLDTHKLPVNREQINPPETAGWINLFVHFLIDSFDREYSYNINTVTRSNSNIFLSNAPRGGEKNFQEFFGLLD